MGKVSKRKQKRERFERRFAPQSTIDKRLIMLLGGIGAMAMGGGAFGQWGMLLRDTSEGAEPVPYSIWILIAGCVLLGVAIVVGTSTETVLRVGSAGVGEEKSQGIRRMPWHELEHLAIENSEVMVLRGKDDKGGAYTIRIRTKTAPAAVARILSEAKARASKAVELTKGEEKAIGPSSNNAGEWAEPPPLQVVGQHCAVSGKVIAYEPDARVCTRCELVFHKNHVPKHCECGNSLDDLREKKA